MTIKSSIFALLCLFTLMTSGCASTSSHKNLSSTRVCHDGECDSVGSGHSPARVVGAIHQLFKLNANSPAAICDATHGGSDCNRDKVCYLVLGGILPGKGCAGSFIIHSVASAAGDELDLVVDMPLSFIGTKVSCKPAEATVAVSPDNVVSIDFSPYHCSWMVMGQMFADFEFHIDTIDTSSGYLSGHWTHSVKGTGNGRGAGFALLKFNKNIDWHSLIESSGAKQPLGDRLQSNRQFVHASNDGLSN